MFLDAPRIRAITAMEVAHIMQREEGGGMVLPPASAAASAASVDSDVVMVGAEGGAPQAVDTGEFSPELVAERAQLIASGFPTWKRDDLNTFVRANAE